jgi:hypothetical protein
MCVESYVLRNVIIKKFHFHISTTGKMGRESSSRNKDEEQNVTHVLAGIHQNLHSLFTFVNIFLLTYRTK